MRISDWSSDVCSSDLVGDDVGLHDDGGNGFAADLDGLGAQDLEIALHRRRTVGGLGRPAPRLADGRGLGERQPGQSGRAACRERVCQYVLNAVVVVSFKKTIL